MPIRASRAYAAVTLAAGITLMGGLGCGGGERAQQSSPRPQQAAVEPVAGKADLVTVSYYYLPG